MTDKYIGVDYMVPASDEDVKEDSIKTEKSTLHPRFKEFIFSIKRYLKNPLTIIDLFIILLFSVIAILSPVIAPPPFPHDPFKIPHTGWKLEPSPPSAEHPLGTLEQQYDILYGIIWGTRSAFKIGFLVVLTNLAIGVVLGSLTGYFGKRITYRRQGQTGLHTCG